MPLIAFRADTGARVESFACSGDEWQYLRQLPKGALTLRNGQPAILKRSIRGLQFFAHPPGGSDPNYRPESAAHLQLKADMVLALRHAGYIAVAEGAGSTPDGDAWEADVLVENPSRRVAIEVQLSQQTLADYEFRSRRYRASGIDVVWMVRATHFKAYMKALYYARGFLTGQRTGHPDFPAFPVRMADDKHHSGTVPGSEVVVWPVDRPFACLSIAQFATGLLSTAPSYSGDNGWSWLDSTV